MKIAVLGHPLAAPENRLYFQNEGSLAYHLYSPAAWKANALARTPEDSGVSTLDVYFNGKNSVFLWKGLRQKLDSLQPDLLYAWSEPWCLSALQVSAEAKRRGIPFFFYAAENRKKNLPLPFRTLEKIVMKRAAAAIAITEEAAQRLLDAGFNRPIYRLPLAVRSYPSLSPQAHSGDIAFVGRLIGLKRVKLLIEAISILPGRSLKIIGDGPEKKTLQDFANRLGLNGRVRFEGTLANDQLSQSLKGSCLLVLPTDENKKQAEQFGKSALEAVSMGIPALCSTSGNLQSLAAEITTLSSRRLNTPAEIARSIENILNHFPSDRELAKSRQYVQETYSLNTLAPQYRDVFALYADPNKRQEVSPKRKWNTRFKKTEKKIEALMSKLTPGGKVPVPPWNHLKRALVVKSCCFGDAILSLYALRELARLHPGLELHVLCTQRVLPVYQNADFLAGVHSLEVKGENFFTEFLSPGLWASGVRLIGQLRKMKFDVLVDLEVYRAYPLALLRLLGIPYSRGFRVPSAPTKPHGVSFLRSKEMAEWKCFYGVLGLEIPTSVLPLYKAGVPEKNRVGIVFDSSPNWPEKIWPLEYFEKTIQGLSQPGCVFSLFGSPWNKEIGMGLRERLQGVSAELVDVESYENFKVELSRCSLVLGNDTGAMHLAAACGVKTLTLFGPTNPAKWNPVTSVQLHEKVSCGPCYYLSHMPLCPHRQCLYQLKPERVMATALEMLDPG